MVSAARHGATTEEARGEAEVMGHDHGSWAAAFFMGGAGGVMRRRCQIRLPMGSAGAVPPAWPTRRRVTEEPHSRKKMQSPARGKKMRTISSFVSFSCH
jgi:metallophosphoesterase superfamily enzyme